MKCRQCGIEIIDEEATFCPECGVRVAQMANGNNQGSNFSNDSRYYVDYDANPDVDPDEETESGKKSGWSKAKIIITSVVAGIILIAVVGGYLVFSWYTSPEQQLYRALAVGDCSKALDIYKNDYEGGEKEKIIDSIEDCLEKIKKDYAGGKIDYEESMEKIAALKKMRVSSVSGALKNAEEYVENMYISKTAFIDAENYYNDGNYQDAIAKYSQVIEDDSNYNSAQMKLSDAINEYRTNELDNAEQYALEGNYDRAIEILEAVLVVLPEDSEITQKLSDYKKDKINERKSEVLSNAQEKAAVDDYIGAYNIINSAIGQNGSDAELEEVLDAYREMIIEEAISKAKTESESSDYLGALRTINQAIEVVGEEETLATAAKTYENAYANAISAQIDAHLAQNDVVSAKNVLDSIDDKLLQNDIISGKKTELDKYKTVALDTLTPINGSFKWNDGVPADPFESDYSNVRNYTINHGGYCGSSHEASVEYKIDKEYDLLKLSISPYEDYGIDAGSFVKVYADNALRYVSPKITQKSGKTLVDVDISDATYLKIVINKGDYGCLMLSDVLLLSAPNHQSTYNSKYTSLATLKPLNGGFPWDKEIPQDIFNSSYTDVSNYSVMRGGYIGNGYTFSAEYYLNSKYKSLSFDMAPYSDFGNDASSYIKVYVDDVLKYTSPNITQKTRKFNTGNIDLTNANYVKIVVERGAYGCIILSDVLLENA